MNAKRNSPVANSQAATGSERRELYVIDDVASIPVMQSRHLFPSFGQWIQSAFRHKVLRKPSDPEYLIECGRFVAARHVPKRIQKYFDEIERELAGLGFDQVFYGTLSALGPYSTATLGMSRKDGEIHYFATQVVTQNGRQIEDNQYFGYISWLQDETSAWTLTPCQLASPRQGVDRLVMQVGTPNDLLRKHRERIRHKKLKRVAPNEYFDAFATEHAKQVNDWAKRGVIRRAKPTEITRIRTEIEG